MKKEIFDVVNGLTRVEDAQLLLGLLEKASGQKIITKSNLSKNIELAQQVVKQSGEQALVESTFIKLGISLEVRKESSVISTAPLEKKRLQNYQIFYAETKADKKIGVADFTAHFRARYQHIQSILMQRPDLTQLIAINKISSERQQIAIIGMVCEKRVSKNKNLIIKVEDLTGSISVVFRGDKAELSKKAEELQLDDIVAIKASGSSEILFGQDIFYPDAYLNEKMRFQEETCIAFLSDVHAGSDRHLQKSMNNFLTWINSSDELAQKINYLFFVGDNIDGVGVFPGQEGFLSLKSMKLQYDLLGSYLARVPKHITMFMCPGQHDASRVAEPQPIIDKKYAEALYVIENLVLVTNPTLVKLIEGEREFKVLMYHGASIHDFINEIPELREIKAHKTPAKAVKHMLKRRHLSPKHSNAVYVPNAEKDPLVIDQVPDVLCTGEVHRLDVETYNNILIITGSCWQAQTAFEEKIGNIPDPAKVPVLNLKTRELKILDFGDEEEINKKR